MVDRVAHGPRGLVQQLIHEQTVGEAIESGHREEQIPELDEYLTTRFGEVEEIANARFLVCDVRQDAHGDDSVESSLRTDRAIRRGLPQIAVSESLGIETES